MDANAGEPITEILSRRLKANGKGPADSVSVLLLEDNPADARLVELYLREGADFSADLCVCETLSAAMERFKEGPLPDVVVADLTLPDSQGIETFQSVHEAVPKIPIVVLSGHEDESLATEIIKRGGQDCIAKDMMTGPLLRRALRHAIERKQIFEELRDMQMQLIQAEKTESVGRLAAGVAHEVKNPLAMIQMGIDYLDTSIADPSEEVGGVLESMRNSVRRADGIVRGLLDFASDRKLGFESRNINSLIETAMVLVNIRMKGLQIDVDMDLAEDLPLVRIDPGKMEQVLINLMFNAIQAMAGGDKSGRLPRMSIRTHATRLIGVERDEGARRATHLRTGDRVVVLEITDNGCGIPEEKMDRIFDPFFTTKPTGTGTGLGLTVVRRIVELHEGRIELENQKEGGVRASLILRAATGRLDASESPAEQYETNLDH